jgi:hypothetical protein
MVAVYSQHKYVDEMRDALSAWATPLQGLIAGKNQFAAER